jgi:hypothetical protein
LPVKPAAGSIDQGRRVTPAARIGSAPGEPARQAAEPAAEAEGEAEAGAEQQPAASAKQQKREAKGAAAAKGPPEVLDQESRQQVQAQPPENRLSG